MSGVYNYWYKVNNPDSRNDIVQMRSGNRQPPFYFGGSQVPEALNLPCHRLGGSVLNKYRKINFKPLVKGKGIQSTQRDRNGNIHMPRHLTLK